MLTESLQMKNPWFALPQSEPFVLPDDKDAIDAFNEQETREQFRIQMHLLPEPFIGNTDAPVVILNLNPGYHKGDDAVHQNPAFQSKIRDIICERPTAYQYPYLESLSGPGYDWSHQKLRWIVNRMPYSSEEEKRRSVAARLLMVESFPYHSTRFSPRIPHVPSQEYNAELVRRAIRRKGVIVLLRGGRVWFKTVPALSTYSRLYTLNSAQNVSISPNNCPSGFDMIVEAMLRDQQTAERLNGGGE